MKLTVSRRDLHEALSVVVRAVPTRTPQLILQGVLLQAEEGKLRLTCTDQEVRIQYEIGATVETAGEWVPPARMLADVIGKLGSETVDLALALEQRTLLVTGGGVRFRLAGEAARDYPAGTDKVARGKVTLESSLLRGMIRQTIKTVSKEEGRPALTGVSLVASGGTMTVASTDTHRLCWREVEGLDAEFEANVILPAPALDLVLKAFPDSGEITVSLRSRGATGPADEARFEQDGIVITTRLIEGPFPDWRRVIPSETAGAITLERAALAAALSTVRVVAEAEKTRRVILYPDGEELRLLAQASGTGSAVASVPFVLEAGDAQAIGFCGAYLADAAAALEGDRIRLRYNGPLLPALFEGDCESYHHIIMPQSIEGVDVGALAQ